LPISYCSCRWCWCWCSCRRACSDVCSYDGGQDHLACRRRLSR
jgi:hypothetical protein